MLVGYSEIFIAYMQKSVHTFQVHWSIGKKVIALMNVSKTCDEQVSQLFVIIRSREIKGLRALDIQ